MEKCIECIHHNICSDWARECYNGDTCFPYEAEKNLCVWYEPVKHGEWIPIVNYFHGKPDGRYYCSECKRVVDKYENYCPACGVKMNGGKSNEKN